MDFGVKCVYGSDLTKCFNIFFGEKNFEICYGFYGLGATTFKHKNGMVPLTLWIKF